MRALMLAFFGMVGSANASEYIYGLGTLPPPFNDASVGLGISPSGNHVVGAKWRLICANGISNNGLITGMGVHQDFGIRAFVLDASTLIPEPTYIGFALLGFALHRRSVRRRRTDSFVS
ncbi:hypothetical protein BH09PLA1_BH09PLA1_04490 [soil metagenome]